MGLGSPAPAMKSRGGFYPKKNTMPQDYMSDGMGEVAEPAAGETKEAPDQDKSETKTALLPLDFFQGKELKPGDTCTVKVESIEQDQVQVSYVPESEEESGESEAAPEAGAAMPQDMMG